MTPFTSLHARYVFPVAGDPIPDGYVTIEGGRIVSVGPGDSVGVSTRHQFRDLGNVAILPGLVNAHAHLDFSDLNAPLGKRGIPFVDWLRLVMGHRRQTAETVPGARGTEEVVEKTLSIRRNPFRQPPPSPSSGLAESLRGGATAIGDIVQPNQPLAASPLEVTSFLELIAPTADRIAGMMDLARSHVFDSNNHRGKWMASESPALTLTLSGHRPKVGRERGPICRPGLSPHAPYSVHLDLLKAVIELSKVHQVPVAMHLAESHEELELLRCGTGPLRAFLEELGAWSQSFIPLGTRPMDFLRLLASAHRALIVHGNYLDDEEIAFLGANAAHIAAVYCPRTHDWFAHAPYPLEKMLAAGATVAVGTDGRGSSPDLNLFEELRFAARRHPDVAWSQILRMGTMDGAKALGREKEIGSLAEGKQADLAIVALPDRDAADPHELLFDSAEPVTACYCRGEEAYRLEINN